MRLAAIKPDLRASDKDETLSQLRLGNGTVDFDLALQQELSRFRRTVHCRPMQRHKPIRVGFVELGAGADEKRQTSRLIVVSGENNVLVGHARSAFQEHPQDVCPAGCYRDANDRDSRAG